MKRIASRVWIILCALSIPACLATGVIPTPSGTEMSSPVHASLTPSPTATDRPSVLYRAAFGIEYGNPDLYRNQGEQSRISDPSVLDGLRTDTQSIEYLGGIYRWLKHEFTAYRAQGTTIGVVTVDDLLASRELGGCHDHGLVYAAVARELGYPAVLNRTDSISWALQVQAGYPVPRSGHVFVEVYLDGRWLLVDSTNGWYVAEGYDPADPVIPLRGNIAGSNEEAYGFYVECKGIDIWDCGIHSPEESNQAMDAFAQRVNLENITYPAYDFQRFTK